MEIIQQLLWSDRQKRQMTGAVIGALIGFLLLLGSVQFYQDFQRLLQGEGSDGQYVQVNKQVNLFNTLGVAAGFTKEEIADLEAQPFVISMGEFVSNQFKVNAGSPNLGFSTEMFFEALPDEYLDVQESRFKWENGQSELPIILSRDYLALYNFGFAPSQGLPQFTQKTIRRVPFRVRISGPGGTSSFQGKVVGFSDRINSILVPISFMEWANARFGVGGDDKPVSRLMLKVDNPLSKEFQEYLKENQLELSTGRMIGGQVATMVNIIAGLFLLLGLLIVVLSVLVFVQNFRLLIAQSKEDIRLLLQLGYRQGHVLGVLFRRQLILLGGIFVVSLILLTIGHYLMAGWLEGQGFDLNPWLHWVVWLVAIGSLSLLVWLNRSVLQKNIASLAR